LVDAAGDAQGLRGSGLIVVNPPWRLPKQLEMVGSWLARTLGRSGQGASRLDWLAGEK
jgi:23S rRNA (adenine2030-N6)-methyltransferase